jgi:hypothetical protein
VQSERDGRDADAGVDAHLLLFTPPYESESQMIEKLWAKVKGFVAAQDHAKRTPAETREHIIEGLYGSARCEGVTTADCKRYILHAKGTANSWLHDSKTLIAWFQPPMDVCVDNITADMRERYWRDNPRPAMRAVHSDSSATDDSCSDSDYED